MRRRRRRENIRRRRRRWRRIRERGRRRRERVRRKRRRENKRKKRRIHSIFDEGIPDPLADHDCYHDGYNVGQTSREFKHDHHQRD